MSSIFEICENGRLHLDTISNHHKRQLPRDIAFDRPIKICPEHAVLTSENISIRNDIYVLNKKYIVWKHKQVV